MSTFTWKAAAIGGAIILIGLGAFLSQPWVAEGQVACPVRNGCTGLTGLMTGFIPFGAGTSPYATSTDLSFNTSLSRLLVTNFAATNGTTTNASSTRLYTTTLGVGSDYLTDLTGNGLTNSGNALTLDATGAWTGTFDGLEGTSYLANSFSTTSAAFWLSLVQGSAFSTTSASYFLSVNQGAAFSTTSANAWQATRNFHSTTSADYWLTQNRGNAFSTTSVDYWKTVRDFFSTTSAAYFLSQNQGPAFSTTSANYWETQQTARTADNLGDNNLDDLLDTNTSGQSAGNVFGYDGSVWKPMSTSSYLTSAELDAIGELETQVGAVNILLNTEIDTAGELATIMTDETGSGGGFVRATLPTLAGFLSTASSTIGGGTQTTGLTISGGATTTGTSVQNGLNLSGALTFGGVTGSQWSDFCVAITGGSGLCDGTDANSAGGTDVNWTWVPSGNYLKGATSTGQGLIVGSTTVSNITATTGTSSFPGISLSALLLNGDIFSDLTGSGLSVSGGTLNCDTASGSVFGCLLSADWSVFNNKISSTSIDTMAELDSLVTTLDLAGASAGNVLGFDGTNWVDMSTSSYLTTTELDTEAELETQIGSVDVVTVTTDDITSANLATLLSNETGTGNAVFSASPTFTGTAIFASLRATASSTIGGGSQATGLTIDGGATTTGNLIVQGTGTSTGTGNLDLAGDLNADQLFVTGATSTFADGLNLVNGCVAYNGTCIPVGGSFAFDDWTEPNTNYITPSSTIGVRIVASSTIGGGSTTTGLTVNGTATTTGLVVTGHFARFGTCLPDYITGGPQRHFCGDEATAAGVQDFMENKNPAGYAGYSLLNNASISNTSMFAGHYLLGTSYNDPTFGDAYNFPNQYQIYTTVGSMIFGAATTSTSSAEIWFATNGTHLGSIRGKIDGLGRWGMGTTSPWATLSVTALASSTAPAFVVASSTGSSMFTISRATSTFFTDLKIDSTTGHLVIPVAANPTVTMPGEIAIDISSSSLRIASSTGSSFDLYAEQFRTFTYATTTTPTGSTTIALAGVPRAITYREVGCLTNNGGSAMVRLGDGTASSTGTSTSNGVTTIFSTLTTNNQFGEGEAQFIQIGNPTGSWTQVTCTYSYYNK